MSQIFDTLYEWSKGLEDARIDETQEEINVQGSRTQSRARINSRVMVNGTRDGVRVTACFEEWHDVAGFQSMTPSYVRDVLEVFAGDLGLGFAGLLRWPTLGDRLLAWLRLRRPFRPNEHVLFTQYRVFPDRDELSSADDFAYPAFCDRLFDMAETPRFWKAIFQKEAGVSAYFRLSPFELDQDGLDVCLRGPLDAVRARREAAARIGG